MTGIPHTSNRDDDRTISFFTDLIDKYSNDVRSCNWTTSQSQEIRFRVLADIGICCRSSVLDIGCGLGDFYGWQNEQKLDLDYLGIDLTPEMIKHAKSKYPSANFLVNSIDAFCKDCSHFDYVIASGIFYLRQDDPVKYLQDTISSMFDICNIGLSFNSLSSWSNKQQPNEFYANPLHTLEYCRKITPFVSLRHDYHHGDFTIHMLRSNLRK